MKERYNSDYIHHKDSKILSGIRDIVFGLEDGMVSTLGAITGIAVGSQSHFTVILAGVVIISVESISMGIGSYISNLSEHGVIKRKLYEEQTEIEEFPEEEKKKWRKYTLEMVGQKPWLARWRPLLLKIRNYYCTKWLITSLILFPISKGILGEMAFLCLWHI